MNVKKYRNALDAMPSDDPMVRDILLRYARCLGEAARLERSARKEADARLRLALLREARGQTQTALVCLREASEHAHRTARTGTRVGNIMPSWLTKLEEEPGEH